MRKKPKVLMWVNLWPWVIEIRMSKIKENVTSVKEEVG